jgi:reductive dehalogenase
MTEEHSFNRRDFLKVGSLSGVLAATGGVQLIRQQNDVAEAGFRSLGRRTYDAIDEIYEIDPDYQRMDQKNTMFSRAVWDAPSALPQGLFLSFFAKFQKMAPTPQEGEPGYAQFDHALDIAAWAGHDIGANLSAAGLRNAGPLQEWDRFSNPTEKRRYQFENKDEAAKIVKRAARFLGADLAGVAPYDERWTYKKWFDIRPVLFEGAEEGLHEKASFPFEPKSVIALAFEMDYNALKTPGHLNDAAVGLEYSHMAEVAAKLAVFLNEIGYKAIPAGNDTGLSIPIAAQAGLGELSRMGTLVTEEYGSRIRLAKVYTDLEMTWDHPKSFGVWEFCKRCRKCADACPSGAISTKVEPTEEPDTGSISSHPGVKKWYQNNERCLAQWERMGVGCGKCLTVCPYNKLDSWHHDLAELVVSVPVGRDIGRELDDFFGYGKMTAKNNEFFWNMEG